jgi:predicted RNA-binding Zn ribbon-like protein
MKLVGGHPALDFVNTVGGWREGPGEAPQVEADKLAGFPDLVAFGLHRGLLGERAARTLLRDAAERPAAARAQLRRAVEFRESLYRTLRSLQAGRPPARRELESLNAVLGAHRSREALAWHDAGLRWKSQPPPKLDAVLDPIFEAASHLLTSTDLTGLRQCGGEGCGWLFLDTSRNRKRRWCSMEDCGNLDKVRRFRRRARRASR